MGIVIFAEFLGIDSYDFKKRFLTENS